MACYHPQEVPYKIINGKKELDWKHRHKISLKDETRIKLAQDLGIPLYKEYDGYTIIKCGKCIGCRLDYAKEWAIRCMLEARYYEHNQFLTMTYDDDKLVYSNILILDKETGELIEKPTLVPEHLAQFMKKLRRYYEYHFNHKDIKFYACGEYGPSTERPHYHVIVFNLPIPDKEKFFIKKGNQFYTSEIINKIWGKGFVVIGDVTWESAGYVARYVMKKLKDDQGKDLSPEEKYKILCNLSNKEDIYGRRIEFVRMSRKEAIGKKYFLDFKEKIYENDEIIMNDKEKLKVVKPPKYYDDLFDIDNHEILEKIKKRRMIAGKAAMELQLAKTDLSKQEYLEVKERNKKEQIKQLKRTI